MSFNFLKGAVNVIEPRDGREFDWDTAAGKVRENLTDAMNARNVGFLVGSGCSSYLKEGQQVGIPTMQPLAQKFIGTIGNADDKVFASQVERDALNEHLGLDLSSEEYAKNLERLMEVLYSYRFVLDRSDNEQLARAAESVAAVIAKVTRFVLQSCTEGPFADGDQTLLHLYQAFYRKLIFRDRALPRPWVFTTNYDTFNETAMDRLSIPYFNGFSGTVERRFNPATFRYSLAEQLDISSRKWTAVDSFVYLCKLHGSITWVEDEKGLFPIRELQRVLNDDYGRVMIYPTPAKQSASLGSPYSDLFREFQSRVVRDQSVLFVLGYSFGDDHINNIIFQALTIPTFRMVAFLPPDAGGVVAQLRELGDPRIWLIGGDGRAPGRKAHYFDTFVEDFMPEPPGEKIDNAIGKVLTLLAKTAEDQAPREAGEDDVG